MDASQRKCQLCGNFDEPDNFFECEVCGSEYCLDCGRVEGGGLVCPDCDSSSEFSLQDEALISKIALVSKRHGVRREKLIAAAVTMLLAEKYPDVFAMSEEEATYAVLQVVGKEESGG